MLLNAQLVVVLSVTAACDADNLPINVHKTPVAKHHFRIVIFVLFLPHDACTCTVRTVLSPLRPSHAV